MDLAQLKAARVLTLAALGSRLKIKKLAAARLEKRTDMYVGTLRRFVEAVDGKLEIVARFPRHTIRISNFEQIGDDEAV